MAAARRYPFVSAELRHTCFGERNPMLICQTATIDNEKLARYLKSCTVRLNINTNEMRNKLQYCTALCKSQSKKQVRILCLHIIDYLSQVLSAVKTTDNSLTITWRLTDKGIITASVSMREFIKPRLCFSDFIELRPNMSLLRIDLTSVLNLLSFELAYRDWGYTFEEIENCLSDCGFYESYSADRLMSLIETKLLYHRTKQLIIGDSPNYNAETGEGYSYFGRNVGKTQKYNTLLHSTANDLAKLLILYCSSKAKQVKGLRGFKLISLTETELCFTSTGSGELLKQIDFSDLRLRLFGRQFNAPLKIDILELGEI